MDSGTSGITCSSALLAAAPVLLADLHGFIHADKTKVSRIGKCNSLLAFIAEELNESLCDNSNKRRSNHVRCNAHVHQTDNGRSRVVGMQC